MISPVKLPSVFFVKMPICAISMSFWFPKPPCAASMAVDQRETGSSHPSGPQHRGGWREQSFLVREAAENPRGGKSAKPLRAIARIAPDPPDSRSGGLREPVEDWFWYRRLSRRKPTGCGAARRRRSPSTASTCRGPSIERTGRSRPVPRRRHERDPALNSVVATRSRWAALDPRGSRVMRSSPAGMRRCGAKKKGVFYRTKLIGIASV